MDNNLLITSGFNFEGYTITEYLGVLSGECALGTGFFSSIEASVSDFYGSKSRSYSKKLKSAKETALQQLYVQVKEVGGNAIIGLDIDYTSFTADIMGVIAHGTAVKVSKINSNDSLEFSEYLVHDTNRGLPFRASKLFVHGAYNSLNMYLKLYFSNKCEVSGILVDVVFTDIFNNSITIENVAFTDFTQSDLHYTCSNVSTKRNTIETYLIKTIDIIVRKYILDGNIIVIDPEQIELFSDYQENPEVFQLEDLIPVLDSLGTAKEIYNYLEEYNAANNDVLDSLFMKQVEDYVMIEKLYGNAKDSTMKIVRNFLQREP